MKYKRKKQPRTALILSCIIILLFVCMATGYAISAGELDAAGYVILIPRAEERPILGIGDSGFALVCDDPNNFAGFALGDGSVSVISQSANESGIFVNYKINVSNGKPRTDVISFDIQNATNYAMTNGTFGYTVTPTNTNVIDGTITANIPSSISPHEVRNYENISST